MLNIAIIGTGISGLGAASLLCSGHNIIVYEQAADIGGHTRTRMVQYADKTIAVDTGFIVFNYRNYPNISKLFATLGVPVQKSDMTFGVTAHNGALEWGAKNLNAVFGQRSNLLRPQFFRLIYDVLTFNRLAPAAAERNPNMTLGQLLSTLKMSQWFADYYILPMGGAIWSCSLDAMLAFPALSFIRFFKAHGLLSVTGQPQWYTVTGGSQEYIKRLIAPFKERIRTSCGVVKVHRNEGKIFITDINGETLMYDRVVFACHGNQALRLLEDATPQERKALGAFNYQKNRMILHKDTSVMPKRKSCWSSWVYHPDGKAAGEPIAVTYWMNLLQNIDMRYPLFVTLNPAKPIPQEHVFDEHEFEHPIYSLDAVRSQEILRTLQGQNNTWYCGAHLRNGFHEDGLSSAVDVAKHMGVNIPW